MNRNDRNLLLTYVARRGCAKVSLLFFIQDLSYLIEHIGESIWLAYKFRSP
jgi:hypothetical protein